MTATRSTAIGAASVARRRDRAWRAGLLGHAGFRRLWLAGWLSQLGSQVSRMGVILYLLESRGAVSGLALLVVLETLPGLLVAPLAGSLVDRYGKTRWMVASDLVRAALLVLLAVRPHIGLIYVVAGLGSVAAAVFQPAQRAALPLVVEGRQLAAANGLQQGAGNAVLVLGPLLGAELMLSVGFAATLLLDAVSYGASALLLAGVVVRAPRPGVQEGGTSRRSPWVEAREGWRYCLGHPVVLQMTALFFVSLVCAGLWVPLAPFFIRDVLGGSERVLGWQVGATGLGAVLGGLWAPRVARRVGAGRLLSTALLAEGACMVVYSRLSWLVPSTALMLVWGIAVSMILVPFYSILQSVVEERFLGRTFSLVQQGEGSALVVAMALAALLAGRLPIAAIFLGAGVVYCAVAGAAVLTPGGRRLLALR